MLLVGCGWIIDVRANTAPTFTGTPDATEVANDVFELQGAKVLFRVTVTDPDTGSDGAVTLTLENGAAPFSINNVGEIRVTASLKTLTSPYLLVVVATDGGTPAMITKETVSFKLGQRPTFSVPSTRQNVSVVEGTATPTGTILATLQAMDPDNSGTIIYSIKSSSPPNQNNFVLNGNKLQVGSSLFDYEKAKLFEIVFYASDGVYQAESPVFTVHVQNVNDNSPVFDSATYVESISEKHPLTYHVLQVSATDLENEDYFLELEYSLTGGNQEGVFLIGQHSGDLILAKHPTLAQYNLQVTASDLGSPPRNSTTDITINVQDDQDECLISPCGINGTCTSGINVYTCVCPPGWTGTICDLSINDCEPNPCQNEGTCTDAHLNFTCSCPPGWTGHTCDKACSGHTYGAGCGSRCICDPARVDPARRNTQMCDVINGVCYCSPQFSGDACYLDVNECSKDPNLCDAAANKECRNFVGGYECACKYGYMDVNTLCQEVDQAELQTRLCSVTVCAEDESCLLQYDRPYCQKLSEDNTSLALGLALGSVGVILLAVAIGAFCFWLRHTGRTCRRKESDTQSDYEPRPRMWMYRDA